MDRMASSSSRANCKGHQLAPAATMASMLEGGLAEGARGGKRCRAASAVDADIDGGVTPDRLRDQTVRHAFNTMPCASAGRSLCAASSSARA